MKTASCTQIDRLKDTTTVSLYGIWQSESLIIDYREQNGCGNFDPISGPLEQKFGAGWPLFIGSPESAAEARWLLKAVTVQFRERLPG